MKRQMLAAIAESAQTPLAVRHVARPVSGKGQVLIRVHAAGVNPLDTKIATGAGAHARQALPAVLGLDLAGTVVELGEGVEGFITGQEVFGMAGGIGGAQGTLAEYIAVDARLIAPKPQTLSMREAAALPLVFITAWEGLVDRANVRTGQRVLIHGAAGGVGQVAVQLAKARGAEVYATGSAASLDFIRSLGATAIDYQAQSVEAYVAQYTAGEGFDIVYDTVGGSTLDASFQAVKALYRARPELPRLGPAQPCAAIVQKCHLFGDLHPDAAAYRQGPRTSRGHTARGRRAGQYRPVGDPGRSAALCAEWSQ
jgi:NADPH:quinone reductase